MSAQNRCLTVALVAAVCLGITVQGASANQLSISSSTYRLTWSTLELASAVGTIRCPVTIEGSFHSRTVWKVSGSLVGYVTRTALGACTGGTARVLTETLPWH